MMMSEQRAKSKEQRAPQTEPHTHTCPDCAKESYCGNCQCRVLALSACGCRDLHSAQIELRAQREGQKFNERLADLAARSFHLNDRKRAQYLTAIEATPASGVWPDGSMVQHHDIGMQAVKR